VKRLRLLLTLAALLLVSALSARPASATIVVDFNDLTPGYHGVGSSVTESGFTFSDPSGLVTTGLVSGQVGLYAGASSVITASYSGGEPFDVTSIVAGTNNGANNFFGIDVTGHLAAGGTVTYHIPATLNVPTAFAVTGFTKLTSITFAMNNLSNYPAVYGFTAAVPEPGLVAMMGACLLLLTRRRRCAA
jgi:hypothetical protein